MTSAFVSVCVLGFTVRNVPWPASARGRSSWFCAHSLFTESRDHLGYGFGLDHDHQDVARP
jgi:hypothetical protein